MNYRMKESISKEEKTFIFEHLLAYNLNHIEDKNPKELGIFADEENCRRMGGLLGSTHGNWLKVDFLWVDEEARGKGIGSVLLEKAEDEARNRGCRYVFLDTFSFQAPGFYTKKGYEQVFVLEEYPRTGKRFYYTKELVQEKAEGQRDNRQRLREFFQAENERNWKVYEQFIAEDILWELHMDMENTESFRGARAYLQRIREAYRNSSVTFSCEKMAVSADGNRIACMLVNDAGEKSNDVFEFSDGKIIKEIEFILG